MARLFIYSSLRSKYWLVSRPQRRAKSIDPMMIAEASGFSKSRLRRGRLLVLAAAVLWSLGGVFIKFLDLPSLAIVFYRSLFAALVFTPFLGRARWQINASIIVSALTYTAAISAFVAANKLTTAANAIVLQYTAPVFVYIFSWLLLGETIAKLNGFALTVSMIGIAMIGLDSAGAPGFTGVLLAILSGFLLAVYMINLRRTHDVSLIYLIWINNSACALLLMGIVQSELALSLSEGSILFVMGALQLGLPYLLFSKGLQSVSLQEASLIALIEPVLNPVWVVLAVGEIPSSATIAGGALILLSLGIRYLWPMLRKSTDPL